MSRSVSGGDVRSPFVPLLLVVIAVLLALLFQLKQLVDERSALAALKVSQMQPLDQSQKLRASLDSVAASTERLAEAGNASATLLVDELRKRGITINPDAQSPPPPR